jgi:putative ABC transport system permease protein
MNLLTLSLANLRFRRLSSFFNVLVLALGIALIITLLHISSQLQQRFTHDLEGIDLVVGAKGSPLQMILSSVFHLDIPNGNIPLHEAEKLSKHPLIKSTIPVALGDNYEGYRIVGTTPDYIAHYTGKFATGKVFVKPMEVVIGSEVSTHKKLSLGAEIVGAHGLVGSDDLHTDTAYRVVGILAPTGSVLDRLVLTPVESVWKTHEEHEEHEDHHEGHKHHDEAEHHEDREITSLLVTYKTPMAAVTLPRMVNKTSSMQAASPAFEVARMMQLLGVGSSAITAFGGVLIGIAAIGFFITLFNAVNERRYDIALMRSLGATRTKVLSVMLAEGLLLGIASLLLGVLLGHLFAVAMQQWIEQTKHLSLGAIGFHPSEIYVAMAALFVSILAAIIPAIMAYRVNVVQVLAEGK